MIWILKYHWCYCIRSIREESEVDFWLCLFSGDLGLQVGRRKGAPGENQELQGEKPRIRLISIGDIWETRESQNGQFLKIYPQIL